MRLGNMILLTKQEACRKAAEKKTVVEYACKQWYNDEVGRVEVYVCPVAKKRWCYSTRLQLNGKVISRAKLETIMCKHVDWREI